MKFTAKGTVWVRTRDVAVEVEGNFYELSKADCRKIVELRKTQGYYSLTEALHGAEIQVEIQRGRNKASLVSVTGTALDLTQEQEEALYEWLKTESPDEDILDEI